RPKPRPRRSTTSRSAAPRTKLRNRTTTPMPTVLVLGLILTVLVLGLMLTVPVVGPKPPAANPIRAEPDRTGTEPRQAPKIGRASCRERVEESGAEGAGEKQEKLELK